MLWSPKWRSTRTNYSRVTYDDNMCDWHEWFWCPWSLCRVALCWVPSPIWLDAVEIVDTLIRGLFLAAKMNRWNDSLPWYVTVPYWIMFGRCCLNSWLRTYRDGQWGMVIFSCIFWRFAKHWGERFNCHVCFHRHAVVHDMILWIPNEWGRHSLHCNYEGNVAGVGRGANIVRSFEVAWFVVLCRFDGFVPLTYERFGKCWQRCKSISRMFKICTNFLWKENVRNIWPYTGLFLISYICF